MKERKISWDKQAVSYFREAIRYIRKNSPQNAEAIKREILEKIGELAAHPEAHAPDKYKINNTGNYRAFELHRFRIGYLVKVNEIIIARIRNTKQEPVDY